MSRRTDKLKEKQNKDEAPLCRRCLRRMSLYETEVGDFKYWCYYCDSPLLGNPATLVENDTLP